MVFVRELIAPKWHPEVVGFFPGHCFLNQTAFIGSIFLLSLKDLWSLTKLPMAEGRYYEAEFPEMEEIVVVQVKRIVDMGAYVSLLEYDNQEAAAVPLLLTCSELLFATKIFVWQPDGFMRDFLLGCPVGR